jgi:hypothetical protein
MRDSPDGTPKTNKLATLALENIRGRDALRPPAQS